MKLPTAEQFGTADLWLRSNEGENGEAQACIAVADYLDSLAAARGNAAVKRLYKAGYTPEQIAAAVASKLQQKGW